MYSMSSDEVIVFVIFNLSYTYMSSVGSGSLLCQVIDPRPLSYLEHCLGASSKTAYYLLSACYLKPFWQPCLTNNRTDILCFLLTNNDNKLLKYWLFQPKQLFLFDKEVTEKYGRVCG